jgi:hypothetical protein
VRGGRLSHPEIRQPRRVAARLSAGARVPGCRESRDKRILATLGKVPQTRVSSKTNDWRIRRCGNASMRAASILSFVCPSGLRATAVAAVGVAGVPRAGRRHGEERHNCHCEDQKTLNLFHRGLHASAKIVRRRPLRRQGGAPALPNAGARSSRTAGGCATVPSVTVMRGR